MIFFLSDYEVEMLCLKAKFKTLRLTDCVSTEMHHEAWRRHLTWLSGSLQRVSEDEEETDDSDGRTVKWVRLDVVTHRHYQTPHTSPSTLSPCSNGAPRLLPAPLSPSLAADWLWRKQALQGPVRERRRFSSWAAVLAREGGVKKILCRTISQTRCWWITESS